MLDASVKKYFPIFEHHPNLVYLDNAATTQTPHSVLEAMSEYYTTYRANTERGLYALSEQATTAYTAARQKIAAFLNAAPEEVIFTPGATYGLNLLARSLAVTADHNIVLTRLEHHANLIPWQQLSNRTGCELRFIELNKDGQLDMATAADKIDEQTRLVSCTAVSNAIGTIAPLDEIIALAKSNGAQVIVDASQLIAHSPIDVRTLDYDWLVFSGHKMYGPTGIGILYGKKQLLEQTEPFLFGGEMIEDVNYLTASWAELPHKFEAGTQNIAGAIGLGAAVDFIQKIGLSAIHEHEQSLLRYTIEQLPEYAALIGPPSGAPRGAIVSFLLQGVHPHDTAEILNRFNIAVRAGHHCAKPLMKYLDIPGTARASFGVYNRPEDVDRLIEGLGNVKRILG